jgi:hypothetical protein
MSPFRDNLSDGGGSRAVLSTLTEHVFEKSLKNRRNSGKGADAEVDYLEDVGGR